MSETVPKILSSELKTIRIICKKCSIAMEAAISSFDRKKRKMLGLSALLAFRQFLLSFDGAMTQNPAARL